MLLSLNLYKNLTFPRKRRNITLPFLRFDSMKIQIVLEQSKRLIELELPHPFFINRFRFTHVFNNSAYKYEQFELNFYCSDVLDLFWSFHR